MRKIIITSILLPISLLSFEVNFNKRFTKLLQPDVLNTDIFVKIESDNEKKIAKKLNLFNDYIKKTKYLSKRLGHLFIRPTFRYSSNAPIIAGYIGEIQYNIQSEQPKDINQFISGLIDLKDNRDTSIVISDLKWKIKESTKNVSIDLLRFEAISWIQTYTTNLSIDLNKECELKTINIRPYEKSTYNGSNKRSYDSISGKKSSIPIPEITNQDIHIDVNYSLECK